MKIGNKGQEEIVGFVVIVLIVALAGVAFLGFSLSKQTKSEVTSSLEVKQFLEAALDYTGNCSIESEGQGIEIRNGIITCGRDSGAICVSGENVCSNINQTIYGILDSSFNVKNGSALEGYEFKANFEGTSNKTILSLTKGKCDGNYKSDYIPYNSYNPIAKIKIYLKLCS